MSNEIDPSKSGAPAAVTGSSAEASSKRRVPAAGADFDLFDVRKILAAIPHRYPFLLVDRITEFVDSDSITCIKNVTFNEPFFQGHFPGRPVMPGVLQIEALAQACALLSKLSTKGTPPDKVLLLVGVDGVRFKRQVLPGDTLTLKVKFEKRRGPLWIVKGEATIDGDFVMGATISAIEGD